MKRVYFAVAILLLIPVFILFGQSYLRKTTASMSQILTVAETSMKEGKTQQAKDELDDFLLQWEKNQKIMATFIRHMELDTINQNSSKLSTYLEDGEKTDFCSECEEIKSQLDHIYQMEKFTFDNFF